MNGDLLPSQLKEQFEDILNKTYNKLLENLPNIVVTNNTSIISAKEDEIMEGARSDYPFQKRNNENIITEESNIMLK